LLSPAAIRVPRAKRTKKEKAPCNQQIGDVDHSQVITQAHVRDCTRRRGWCIRHKRVLGVLSHRDTSQRNVPDRVQGGVQQVSQSAGRGALQTNGAYEVRPSPLKDAARECVLQGTQGQRISIGHARGEVVKLMLAPANQRSTISGTKLDSKSGFSLTHMSEKYFKSRTLETLTRAADASIESQKVSVLQQMNGCCRRSVNCLSRGRGIRIVASTSTQTVLSSEFTASSHTKLSSQAFNGPLGGA